LNISHAKLFDALDRKASSKQNAAKEKKNWKTPENENDGVRKKRARV